MLATFGTGDVIRYLKPSSPNPKHIEVTDRKRLTKSATSRKSPLLTICVSAHGYADRVLDFITHASAIREAEELLQIVIVNDGDQSDDWKRLLAYVKFCGLELLAVETENKGLGSSRNEGLQLATGEFVVFLDGDDYLHLKPLLRIIRNHVGKDVIVGQYSIELAESGKLLEIKTSTLRKILRFFPRYLPVIWGNVVSSPIHSLIVRKSICPSFAEDLSFGEDLVFWSEVIAKKPRIEFTTEHFAVYRYHKSQMTRNTLDKSRLIRISRSRAKNALERIK